MDAEIRLAGVIRLSLGLPDFATPYDQTFSEPCSFQACHDPHIWEPCGQTERFTISAPVSLAKRSARTAR